MTWSRWLKRLSGTRQSEAPRPCPVSGHRGRSLVTLGPVATTQPGSFSADRFRLVYSRKADLVYLDPLPTTEDFDSMYSAGQFDSDEYTDPSRIESMHAYYSDCIGRHFDLRSGAPFRLLEAGAGMAWVSRSLKAMCADAVTVAQDISSECLGSCPWVDDYVQGSIEDCVARFGPSFNAISLTHVIEHVPDPVKTLQDLRRLSAPGGKILLTGPSCPPGWSLSQGLAPWMRYSYLHVPAHVTYFSRQAMRLAAGKAGLQLAHWDGTQDSHQAFEAVLELPASA